MQNKLIQASGNARRQRWCLAPRLLAVAALLPGLCPGLTAGANPAAAGTSPSELAQIVVQARKLVVPDEVVTQHVESAIQTDIYLNVDHVTIETRNGVVHLQGIIQDPSELGRLERLVRRIAGVRRVVNETELEVLGVDAD